MAPDVADKIFLPFYQADQSATRKRGGTGLGLAITKKLVELMGGTIAVQSNLGEGTKFTVDLPFELATTSSSELKDNPSPSVEETDTSIGVFGNDAFTICAITEYASALGKKLVLFNTAADLPPTDAKSVRLLFVLEAALDTQKSRDMLAEWYAACSKPPTLALLRDRKCLGCSTVSERQLVFIKQVWLPLKQTHFVGIVRAVEQGLPFTTSSEDDMLSPSPSSNPSLSAYRSAMPAAAQYSTLVYPRTQGSRPEVPVAKVLVAEDNPISQRVLSMLIVKEGFAVDIAGTGREAYDLLQTKHAEYSIILMDLQMPEMDGLAATALIREWEDQHALHHIPILAVTACAMQEDRERCLAAGMADYVTKPINRDTLRELFQKYIVRGSR
jgi:CheY-like chemotaxis protein